MGAAGNNPAIEESLRAALAERILVLDGAMGTMIQAHALTEEDFRGECFSGHSRELKGNNDLLSLTRADTHPAAPRSRKAVPGIPKKG